ncbi:aldo/keto reductase family oxidoreductase [Vibrio sp. HN007]|uniref:aldo/keto reductase n=1 Tax=Vibrio iocasae TaxID=3098914 RepID=UPI0035D49ADF
MTIDSKSPLNSYLPTASRLVYGCMGLGGGWNETPVSENDIYQARTIIDTALETGINVFDHADIYTFSKAESTFGQALADAPSLRDQMLIQSKCGIRFEDNSGPGRYDFSAHWITESVHGILERLRIEKLDVLLLHRPDPLVELDELAGTLEKLKSDGKFDFLGVSNMNSHQIRYLQSALNMPIVANQIEMSLAKTDWLDNGVLVGSDGNHNVNFDSGLLEHCQLENIQLQAWGSLAQGRFSENGLHSQDESIRRTSQRVLELAQKYQVPGEAIVIAFLLRHPARVQPVIGTTNPDRIRATAKATKVTLTREEWYSLYVSSRGNPLP